MTERATRAGQRGVTLLELTVAMGIFAIVGAVLFGTFSRTATSRDLVERRAALYFEARTALETIERDLQASFDVGGYTSEFRRFYVPEPRTAPPVAGTRLVADFTALSARGIAIAGLGDAVEIAGARGDQMRVRYWLGDDGDLLREVRRPPRPLENPDEILADEPLASDVAKLELRFYDGGEWLDSWTSARAGRRRDAAPGLVTIALAIERRDEPKVELHTTVVVPMGLEVRWDRES